MLWYLWHHLQSSTKAKTISLDANLPSIRSGIIGTRIENVTRTLSFEIVILKGKWIFDNSNDSVGTIVSVKGKYLLTSLTPALTKYSSRNERS